MTVYHSSDYCVFEYMYRDAGNWKTFGEVLLAGCYAPETTQEIQRLLGGDGLFVAEQIALPPLQPRHLRSCGAFEDADLDHAFHEFLSLRAATSDCIAAMTVRGSLDEIVEVMRVLQGSWDVALSPFAHCNRRAFR